MNQKNIFVTGGTGYIGSRLIRKLVEKNYLVKVLVREGSEKKISGAVTVAGNALDVATFSNYIEPTKIFMHLVGVAHPRPRKKQQFIDIDLASIHASVEAAKNGGLEQFIYMSVAQPNNIMKDYTEVRMEGEKLVKENFGNATFIRPFYVLGPGHYWPLLLTPLFNILSFTKEGKERATRLGLVWIGQMINALLFAVENPVNGIRILEVKDIKTFSKNY